MKRERQWDMFDVATGACPLDDYLFQRYSENDLQSKFWVESSDEVDELRPAPKGSKEQVIIPVQGPRAGTPKAAAAQASADPLPSRPPWETAAAGEAPLPSRPSWEAASSAPIERQAPLAPSRPVPVPPPAPPAPVRQTMPDPPSQQQPAFSAATPRPVETPVPTEPEAPPQAPAAPAPPSMAELLAQFHQAAKAYEERSKDELGDSPTDQ